jgi:hypothetical protein
MATGNPGAVSAGGHNLVLVFGAGPACLGLGPVVERMLIAVSAFVERACPLAVEQRTLSGGDDGEERVHAWHLRELLRSLKPPGEALVKSGSNVDLRCADLYNKSDRLVVRTSDGARLPQRWLLVTKEAIAEYWFRNAFIPPTLGIVLLAGLPGKAHCKVLETLVRTSQANLMCLTDLSPDGVRTLLLLQRQLREVRPSFFGVSDGMIRAIDLPFEADTRTAKLLLVLTTRVNDGASRMSTRRSCNGSVVGYELGYREGTEMRKPRSEAEGKIKGRELRRCYPI